MLWGKVKVVRGGLDCGGGNMSTSTACVDMWEIGVKSRWTAEY